MRILHISTRLILGGSQENTVLSCEGQARLGHEVHLAFGPIYGPEGSMLSRVEKFNVAATTTPDVRPITLHEVKNLEREIMPATDRRCVTELCQLIKAIRPDVVHTHSSKAGILGRIAAWKVSSQPRRPSPWSLGSKSKNRIVADSVRRARLDPYIGIVHTIHGPPFMPVEGGFSTRLKTSLKNTLYTMSERHAAARCHVIVSVADAMTRQFLERGIGQAGQYITVHSGMEIESYLSARPGESREAVRRSLGLTDADFVIGTVARLAEHKGHDDLLDALHDELKRRPDWKLLWVGDGWWKERLVAKAKSMGLGVAQLADGGDEHPARSAQILLTGLVPPERVPAMMRAMDVLAHPSTREGLPRTVPQALLSGVCPIAYDVDGTSEACIEMQTGRLVPPGNQAKLREAIVWAAEHPEERRALASRGKEMCKERFSAERMVAQLESVYARSVELANK